MKKNFFIILILVGLITAGSKKANVGISTVKGNTHTHAKYSDKNDTNDVPKIAKWYRDAGYDFLVLSEHNDRWAVKKIICHNELTEPDKFLMICGLELSKKRHHTALGIKSYIGDESSLQDGVNKTNAAGGLAILNHPQAPVVTTNTFIATKGLNHLEVFNGQRPVQTAATELLWDSILSAPNGRPVYAVASDDNHYKKSSVGRGWIMVSSPALTAGEIEENIRKGNFYASTGVILNDYQASKKTIVVDSKNGDTITFLGKNGNVLSTVTSPKATYKIIGNELYIRVKITNSEGESAWTQPVFVN
jgi:hypothetical protein